eukprot:1161848-Pelagomonas_calceolata.AAC.8
MAEKLAEAAATNFRLGLHALESQICEDTSAQVEEHAPYMEGRNAECATPHLQAQCAGDLRSAHQLATHAEAVAAGGDALAAQLGQRIHCALAHAHVVGGDPGSKAFQSRGAGGRSSGSRGCSWSSLRKG